MDDDLEGVPPGPGLEPGHIITIPASTPQVGIVLKPLSGGDDGVLKEESPGSSATTDTGETGTTVRTVRPGASPSIETAWMQTVVGRGASEPVQHVSTGTGSPGSSR